MSENALDSHTANEQWVINRFCAVFCKLDESDEEHFKKIPERSDSSCDFICSQCKTLVELKRIGSQQLFRLAGESRGKLPVMEELLANQFVSQGLRGFVHIVLDPFTRGGYTSDWWEIEFVSIMGEIRRQGSRLKTENSFSLEIGETFVAMSFYQKDKQNCDVHVSVRQSVHWAGDFITTDQDRDHDNLFAAVDEVKLAESHCLNLIKRNLDKAHKQLRAERSNAEGFQTVILLDLLREHLLDFDAIARAVVSWRQNVECADVDQIWIMQSGFRNPNITRVV